MPSFIAVEKQSPLKEVFSIALIYNISHITILDEGFFMGNLPISVICGQEQRQDSVETYLNKLEAFSIAEDSDLFQAIGLMSNHRANLIPVVDSKNRYAGSLLMENILFSVGEIFAVQSSGHTIEILSRDDSTGEICRIVEQANAKVLYCLKTKAEEGEYFFSLKFSAEDILPVLNDLVRYGYTIVRSETMSFYNEGIRQRFESLMNFLRI